ncbi:MAG: hypothetical protein AAGI13_10115 [Pseudomonadota bacterium]
MRGAWRLGGAVVISSGLLAVAIVSCTTLPVDERSQRDQIAQSWHTQRMVILRTPPVIAAETPEDLPAARLAAERADPAVFATRLQAREVGIDALPYLIGSAEGRAFLKAQGSRAIARGRPADICPSTAVVSRLVATPRGDLAGDALQQCLQNLPQETEGCGCRIVAIDNLVTVTQDDLTYATGTTARLSLPSRGIDRVLVAEEDQSGALLLRDLRGQVATVRAMSRETVALAFADGTEFSGRRIKVGFRRGRMAERIYAESASGERLVLLIGFEPDELAERAAAWLAWPKEG